MPWIKGLRLSSRRFRLVAKDEYFQACTYTYVAASFLRPMGVMSNNTKMLLVHKDALHSTFITYRYSMFEVIYIKIYIFVQH